MSKGINFSSAESLWKEANDESNDKLLIAALGTTWSYPSYKTLKHLNELLSETNEIKLKSDVDSQEIDLKSNVTVFLLDADENAEMCVRKGVVVGVPAIFMYHKGRSLTFEKRGNVIKGMLNTDQLRLLIQDALSITRNPSDKLEVPVHF